MKADVTPSTAATRSTESDSRATTPRPLSRPRAVAGTAGLVLGLLAYFFVVFLAVRRDGIGYKFVHFLFDYAHGITRRALEGEIVRHIVPPPYDLTGFRYFSECQMVLAMLLMIALLVALFLRRRTTAWWVLGAVVVTSPLTFKQIVYDQGRQDLFGFLALEVTMLLALRRSPRAATWFVAAMVFPLSLINENELLLYVPACLAVVTLAQAAAGVVRTLRERWVPWAVTGVSFAVNLVLPPPRIPLDAYDAYLRSKSALALPPGMPHRWLYSNIRENLAFAAREWHRLGAEHLHHAADYLVLLGLVAFVALAVWAGLRRTSAEAARWFAAAVLIVLPFYLVLYVVASDLARWTANLGACVLLVTLFAADVLRVRITQSYRLWLVATFQFFIHAGLGVTVATLGLVERAQALLAYYRH